MDRLPGFRDFYPDPVPHKDVWSARVRRYVLDVWRDMARRYGFFEYDGPPLEPLELYTLKSGQEIVHQLFEFIDKGGRAVALRPEMTPTLARMVAAHHRTYKKPLKWFAIPQLFRYEKQQRGRLREHFQFNADILGEPGPGAEAELIALLVDTLCQFGLSESDFVVRVSSRIAWDHFYAERGGKPELIEDFYLAVDKLDRDRTTSETKLKQLGIDPEQVYRFIEEAPPTPDLESLLMNLRARNLDRFVRIDYRIIRGLAYYTGIVFEAFDTKGEFRAIAGGGRYDRLIKLISKGKVDMPAAGFGMGDVVLTELLTARKLIPERAPALDVYIMVENEALRMLGLAVAQKLRQLGMAVDYPLGETKPDKQYKHALELGVDTLVRLQIRNSEPVAMIRRGNAANEISLVNPTPESLVDHIRKSAVK